MSVTVKLPDGSEKQYQSGICAMDIASGISEGLARASVAAEVDGKLTDLTSTLADGKHNVRIITDRDAEALEILRHTAAHVLAQAVVRLYGAKVKYTIGPALTDDFQYGFYYDFDLPVNISSEDFQKIEAEMKKIASEKLPVERIALSVDEAKKRLSEIGQSYKTEMIDDLVKADGSVKTVSLYKQGEFLDMCRGPHLPNTSKVKVFKLLSTAGAYWRGDENNKMLTRIYGTAFFDKKDLSAHLERIEQARKRDHRLLGKQLGLFTMNENVGPGLALWMPKGSLIRMELETWLRSELLKQGYSIVYTPHIGKLNLWKTSGHYPYYKDSQFPPIQFGDEEGDEGFLLKPMNCPFHIEIFKTTQHSYRDLPVRLAEFGNVYRWEQSGELSGLIRVRGFTQDDAHIFCTPDQLEGEITSCVNLTKFVLETLGLSDYRVRVSLRDPDSSKYVGDREVWDIAETHIRNVVKASGMDYSEASGEAAFYGPKIDFIIKDCIGRDWQLGTVQVDYNLPARFGLEYIGADNHPHQPIMIHRAPFGSLERFIGILIEHYAGAFPLWLSPVQAAVLPVSEKTNEYAGKVAQALQSAGVRVDFDTSPEKIGAKIRRATLEKIPYMAVVGPKECDQNTVAVRHRTEGDLGSVSIENFVEQIKAEIATKGKQAVNIS